MKSIKKLGVRSNEQIKSSIMNYKINIFRSTYPLIIALWVFVYFFLLLKTGFIGDDIWNVQIKGQLIEQNIGLIERINSEWKGWLFSSGSIRVFYYFIIYPIFFIIQDPVFFKALTLFFLISSSVLFYYFTAKLSRNKDFALVASLFLPAFFQFREWNDPILGFPSFIILLTVSLILISLLFYKKYTETLNAKYNYIATLFFLINIMIYEIAVPFFIAYIILSQIKFKKIRPAIIESRLQIIVTALYLSVVFFLNNIYIPIIMKSSVAYTAVKFHHSSFSKLAEALIIQFTGGIPLTHQAFNGNRITDLSMNIYELIILLIMSLLIYKVSRKIMHPNTEINKNTLIKMSVLLSLAPAFLTALSGHQGDLRYLGYGSAYIPVYIQYFGMCGLLLSFVVIGLDKIDSHINVKCFLVAFLFFILSGLNYSTNKAMLKKLHGSNFKASNIVTASLTNGIMNKIEGNSMIFRRLVTPSNYYRNYTAITGKKFITCELENIDQRAIDGTDNYKNCINYLINDLDVNGRGENNDKYFLAKEIDLDLTNKNAWVSKIIYSNSYDNNGYVLLGKIKNLKKIKGQNRLSDIRIDEMIIFNYQNQTISSLKYNDNFVDILNMETTQYQEISDYLLEYIR